MSAMKSMAAIVPARPSKFGVPVSQTNGGSACWVDRRSGSTWAVASRRAYMSPTCGPKNL